MTKFRVGDTVRIKRIDEICSMKRMNPNAVYGLTRELANRQFLHGGEIAAITAVVDDDCYKLSIDHNRTVWSASLIDSTIYDINESIFKDSKLFSEVDARFRAAGLLNMDNMIDGIRRMQRQVQKSTRDAYFNVDKPKDSKIDLVGHNSLTIKKINV